MVPKPRIFICLHLVAGLPLEKSQGEQMTLRIDISDQRERLVLTLTGRIQAEQVLELQNLLRRPSSDHNLVLDLREVRLVDRDAVRFLAEIETKGAKLRNCSAFIREWIWRERDGMRQAEVEHRNGTGE
jgi:hypothetical protein